MSSFAIRVEQLAKRYRIGVARHDTLRDRLSHALRAPLRRWRGGTEEGEFWALRDVSFEVPRGEVLGIIGRNGAGKSTLLKILSRITEPTRGRAVLRGRVASLLEVGTGFHAELTGRENIFLNGAILGMSRAEIRRRFDEIVAFSEVEQFLDTPVKHYSSGMYVRLAFAVAAHLEPEILIVDEVLAVGDAQFQKKCLGKMGDVVRRDGRTVLFVSHNMVAVQSLCRQCLLLHEGRVLAAGDAASCIARYHRSGDDDAPLAREWDSPESGPGTDRLRLARVRIAPEAGAALTMRTPFTVELEYWARPAKCSTHLTLHLLNDQGIVVLTSGSRSQVHAPGRYRAVCHFPGQLLNSGRYVLKLLVVENENQVTYVHDTFATFTVEDDTERTHAWLGREPGVVQPPLRWETSLIGLA